VTESHKMKDSIVNLQKSKENTISESFQAEKEMPKLEKQCEELKK
jgi:hypothetical protein